MFVTAKVFDFVQVSEKTGRGAKSKVKSNCKTKMQTEKEQDCSGDVAIKLEAQVKNDPDQTEEKPLDIQQSNGHDSSNPAGQSAFLKHIFFFN